MSAVLLWERVAQPAGGVGSAAHLRKELLPLTPRDATVVEIGARVLAAVVEEPDVVAGLLERPSAGEVMVAGKATSSMTDDERTALRRNQIGFVYQFHHLLPEFSALENLVLPQMIAGLPRAEAGARARELLGYLGVAARETHRPAELSGGEQQRVAIARAVANAPRILLADEPTGNLDPRTAERVFSAMTELVSASGLAAIIATHNMDLAARMDRRVTLRDGKVVEVA